MKSLLVIILYQSIIKCLTNLSESLESLHLTLYTLDRDFKTFFLNLPILLKINSIKKIIRKIELDINTPLIYKLYCDHSPRRALG